MNVNHTATLLAWWSISGSCADNIVVVIIANQNIWFAYCPEKVFFGKNTKEYNAYATMIPVIVCAVAFGILFVFVECCWCCWFSYVY